jgi:hypothetical protein
MITKILIAYDGSESAKEAMDFAFELAHHFNSELYVMAVCHLTEFGGEVEMLDFVSRTQSYFYQRMRNLRKQYPEMKKTSITYCHRASGRTDSALCRWSWYRSYCGRSQRKKTVFSVVVGFSCSTGGGPCPLPGNSYP